MSSQLLEDIRAAQLNGGNFTFQNGAGGDPDTLGKALVWVYDTATFPFYQAETYHQFHDDMVDHYNKQYHNLQQQLLQQGLIVPTGCPRDSSTPGKGRSGGGSGPAMFSHPSLRQISSSTKADSPD